MMKHNLVVFEEQEQRCYQDSREGEGVRKRTSGAIKRGRRRRVRGGSAEWGNEAFEGGDGEGSSGERT